MIGLALYGGYMREEDHFDILQEKNLPLIIELVVPPRECVLQLAQAVEQLQAKKPRMKLASNLAGALDLTS